MISYQDNPMFYELTGEEMLDMVKRQNLLSPQRRDCVLERDDGIDLDDYLQERIDRWYAEQLLTAESALLPVEDVRENVSLTVASDGVVTATLPPRAVRPVEFRLAGWGRAVTRFLSPDDPACALQHNPFTRGRSESPAAIDYGDCLALYSATSGGGTLTCARCVVRPSSGHYIFHRSLLPLLALY